MTEFYERYYPTLCIRRAEMKAAEKLPPAEKAKFLPIVLLAPWLNSIKFENTFERIKISLGDIPMIVDLDRFYQSSSDLESRRYFRSLLLGDDSINRWIELIAAHQNYIPTVQMEGRTQDQIQQQIAAFSEMARGIVFRFELGRGVNPAQIDSLLPGLDLNNSLFVLDGGWTDYTLEMQSTLMSHVEHLTSLSDEVRIVVSTSNFPNNFGDLDNMAAVNISSRKFYSEIRQTYGNYQVYYGDWASTKPRRYDGGGSKPLARIDYPLKDRWVISRSKEEEWDFIEAAKRVTRLPEWVDHPNVWGASMIEKTAKNLPGAISTGPQAIASRINIHLFMQNNYQVPDVQNIPTETPWNDPI
ncbi:hypothetical protein VCJ71_12315 [Alteriqipengyuania sp. WL0013]|uniref:beta family protein n=1 Tax=Alteriqipengyuania sp. WL0013 TaxID=3110773 RepID=UPI002C2D6ECA|nr:hypothetical protein [Alteriqipengyuania sp. WL0013]MEB3416847.1 hypothetical protein [Alteriqipengyuania sp. WL0013]